MKMHTRGLLPTLVGLILSMATTHLRAAPEAELWERWSVNNPLSTLSINHNTWSSWLGRYVTRHPDGINRLDYRRVQAADRETLRAYIDGLANLKISDFNRKEQKAYWINLYNAYTVDVVLSEYPVESIRDIGGCIFIRSMG